MIDYADKSHRWAADHFEFLGISWNVSGQKLLVYHILILIHRGAKLYY